MISENITIGILGGGQLGKMLCLAASKLGINCHIFDPDINCPAKYISKYFTNAEFYDEKELENLLKIVMLLLMNLKISC